MKTLILATMSFTLMQWPAVAQVDAQTAYERAESAKLREKLAIEAEAEKARQAAIVQAQREKERDTALDALSKKIPSGGTVPR